MTAAPYFHTQFTEEASKELTEQVQQRFLNVVENLSKTLGLNVRQVFDNLGGFHDDKLNSQVRELSYTIEFDDADIDKINLFTCLLGDLGHEVQNSVYNIRYTDKDDANADGIHMLYFKWNNEAEFQEKWKKVKENIEGAVDIQIYSNYLKAAEREELYNKELKKLEEDDLRRKKSNEQRFDTKNDRLDTQKLPERKVREQDRRLHQLLNEALETNQKYRDSGGTTAIQTGETLKEGTNAITPGQTYEDYVRENQDGVAYFEAFIPVYDSIFKEFADSEGTISVEALEYLHPDIMKMIVYRIPTEGRHSIMPVKGIQFMPIEMGGTIMLPDEMIHLLKQTI